MTILRKFLVAAAAGALGLAGMASAVQAAEWNMPTPYGPNNFHTMNIQQFAMDVGEATDGELTIRVHPGGSLLEHPQIRNGIRSGQVPIGEFLLSLLSNENAVYGVDSIPFLATSYEDARRLWDASRPVIEEMLGEQGLRVLYAVPWPPQGLYARQEIATVDDLRGLKFRSYNALTARLANLAGAVPTQVEVPDIPQAFATGRVEAMITSPSTGANTQAWDFVSHFHHLQAWLPKNAVVVNADAFDGLPDAQQQAILDAARAAEERGWEASMNETQEKIAVLRENGMEIVAPSGELMGGLQEIGRTMTEEWLERAGEQGQRILDAYRGD